MSPVENRDQEQKDAAADLILRALDACSGEGCELDPWERARLVEAIRNHFHGMYAAAAASAAQVGLSVQDRAGANDLPEYAFHTEITVEKLRAALAISDAEPLSRWPNLGSLELIP
jgi:hypothetical protein